MYVGQQRDRQAVAHKKLVAKNSTQLAERETDCRLADFQTLRRDRRAPGIEQAIKDQQKIKVEVPVIHGANRYN